MSDSAKLVTTSDNSADPRVLPRLAEVLDTVLERFSITGALGLILVDGEPLRPIEQKFGPEAFERARSDLGQLVRSVAEEIFGDEVILSSGETGRCEALLLVASEGDHGEFYMKDLPAALELVRRRLEQRQGQRIGYPYMRRTPRLSIGSALVLRNPHSSVATEVRALLDEAREDAHLDSLHAHREDRRRMLELITCGQLHSVYEPIVDAKRLTVFGYEALARGPVDTELAAPLVMFGLAEKEGLTFALDCLCRDKAIEGAIDFPSGAKLFINIRPSCFHDPSFKPDALKRTLERCNLGPTDVVFEISEQESIDNYEILREARDFYGSQGFQFALDDTGAGYASLEAVMQLTPEFIKVDRAFVAGIDTDASRRAMVEVFRSTADTMGAQIIGEGLDTLAELETLGEMGIAFGQGWLFGKATPLRGTH